MPDTQHLDALQLAGLAYMDFDMALNVTGLCECGDARDRVFGILPLVKWPRNDPGIAVDYDKSCFQVALESLKHLGQLETAFGLFSALDLSCFQPEMVALRVTERHETEVTKVTDSHKMAATISADEEGTLKVSVAQRGLGTTIFAYTPEEVSSQVENICQESANPSQRPKTLMSTRCPVGFVCADAAPGDILLSIGRIGDTSALHLVVREAVEGSYDVIGQAFFLPHFEILRYPHPTSTDISLEGTRPATEVRFELSLSVADLLYLVGQDNDHGRCDVKARVGRMSNNPFSSRLGAVKIWPRKGQS